MPCYEPRDNSDRVEYVYRDTNETIKKIRDVIDINAKLEASLCAIISELEKKGIAYEVISQASKSGLVDLVGFWEEHSKEDETRLAKSLHQYSEHEQAILKGLLSKVDFSEKDNS